MQERVQSQAFEHCLKTACGRQVRQTGNDRHAGYHGAMVGVGGHAIGNDLEQAPKFAVEPVQVPQVQLWAAEYKPGLRRARCLVEEVQDVGLHPGEDCANHVVDAKRQV